MRLADGQRIAAGHAVLADVSAPCLYRNLIGLQRLPDRLVQNLGRFEWDAATVKVNWALSPPVPWTACDARGAGTVHLGVDLNGYHICSRVGEAPAFKPAVHPARAMTTSVPTRSPAGTESACAYTHVPEGLHLSADDVSSHVELIESLVERDAPGFESRILARTVQAPLDLQAADANLHGGAVSGGTAGIHQQLIFRPLPGLGPAETPRLCSGLPIRPPSPNSPRPSNDAEYLLPTAP